MTFHVVFNCLLGGESKSAEVLVEGAAKLCRSYGILNKIYCFNSDNEAVMTKARKLIEESDVFSNVICVGDPSHAFQLILKDVLTSQKFEDALEGVAILSKMVDNQAKFRQVMRRKCDPGEIFSYIFTLSCLLFFSFDETNRNKYRKFQERK